MTEEQDHLRILAPSIAEPLFSCVWIDQDLIGEGGDIERHEGEDRTRLGMAVKPAARSDEFRRL